MLVSDVIERIEKYKKQADMLAAAREKAGYGKEGMEIENFVREK